MRLLLQTIFLFYSIASFGQLTKTATIKLSKGGCRREGSFFQHWADTITFFKLPEDIMAFQVIPRQYRTFPIKIENIVVGKYKLSYKNNFGQLVTKQVSLTDFHINSITTCPDSLSEYPQNTLSKLLDKDTISISFNSQGCFHSSTSKILISKEAGNYVASLYSPKRVYVTKLRKKTIQYQGDSLYKTVILTTKNIQDFTRFENELNFATYDGGCTTTDWYVIRSKFLDTKKIDGSCTWRGFYFLQKSFFGDDE